MRVLKRLAPIGATIGVAILSLTMGAVTARAQELPLAQVLPDLILREIVLQRGLVGPPHAAHFSPLDPTINDLNNPVVGIVQRLQLADGHAVLDVSAWARRRAA